MANEICFEDEIALRIVTQAFNEALELAARECDDNSPKPFTTAGIIERAQCAAAIRKLKVAE